MWRASRDDDAPDIMQPIIPTVPASGKPVTRSKTKVIQSRVDEDPSLILGGKLHPQGVVVCGGPSRWASPAIRRATRGISHCEASVANRSHHVIYIPMSATTSGYLSCIKHYPHTTITAHENGQELLSDEP